MKDTPQILNIPINSFDFVRLAATLIVATSHFFSVPAYEEYAGYVKYFVGFEVILSFFMLSGFLLVGSYLRSPDLKTYFIKRFSRIYPAYIVILLLLCVGMSGLSSLSLAEYFTHPDTYKYLLANLFFLNFLQPTLPGVFEDVHAFQAVNGSLWTLKIEVAFYFVLPIIIEILMRLKRSWMRNTVLLVVYVSSFLYEYLLGFIPNINESLRHSLSMQFPAFMHVFAMGIFMYFNFDWIKRHLNVLWIPMLLCLAENAVSTTYYFFPIGLGLLIFYIGFQLPQLRHLVSKHDYSYGVYIYHYPVIQLLIQVDLIRQLPVISYFIFIGSSFILAMLSWHYVELPWLRSSRYKSK